MNNGYINCNVLMTDQCASIIIIPARLALYYSNREKILQCLPADSSNIFDNTNYINKQFNPNKRKLLFSAEKINGIERLKIDIFEKQKKLPITNLNSYKHVWNSRIHPI